MIYITNGLDEQKIRHRPVFSVEKVLAYYGKDYIYVCTTAKPFGSTEIDVYHYTPGVHPKFNNRYLGVLKQNGGLYVTNMDEVENYKFALLKNKVGDLVYSQHVHDFVQSDDSFVDGGRDYIRSGGNITLFEAQIKDGKFQLIEQRPLVKSK
jgi:hypothetical protein